jgi:hypothetical protein
MQRLRAPIPESSDGGEREREREREEHFDVMYL